MQLKTQESKDIQTVNRIVVTLRPYLCLEDTITTFVQGRTAKQIEEIKTPGLKNSALAVYHFTLGDVELGRFYAEESLKFIPNDVVAWRHYIVGLFWRCGAVEALKLSKRGIEFTNSPILVSDAYYYSSAIADFPYFLKMRDFLLRTERYEDFAEKEQEPDMIRSLEYARIVSDYKKENTIKNVSELMYERLSLAQKLNSVVRIIDVTEDDGHPELIFEMHIPKAEPDVCANMNTDLIAARVRAGLTDWSVGCVYVAHDEEGKSKCL